MKACQGDNGCNGHKSFIEWGCVVSYRKWLQISGSFIGDVDEALRRSTHQ